MNPSLYDQILSMCFSTIRTHSHTLKSLYAREKHAIPVTDTRQLETVIGSLQPLAFCVVAKSTTKEDVCLQNTLNTDKRSIIMPI